jgi:hypothetical protein
VAVEVDEDADEPLVAAVAMAVPPSAAAPTADAVTSLLRMLDMA